MDNTITSTYIKSDMTTGYNSSFVIKPIENTINSIPTNPINRKENINYNAEDEFSNNKLLAYKLI